MIGIVGRVRVSIVVAGWYPGVQTFLVLHEAHWIKDT